ncbi:uncharacterized protein LOC119189934 [Manduca sexta]|uniref:uncharacterized protein LOC119189934 n=1 Tax=Manduca sexta TaxID=7130 RepID=UPI00188E2E1B|nr:uncharacterized protein LOC119189934 [Manduca sexta]
MKRVNTRIQNMISSCLNRSDNKENDDQEFYDNSRPSSPMQFSSGLLGKRRKFCIDVVANNSHEKTPCMGGDGTIPNPIFSAKLPTVFAETSQSPLSPQLPLCTNLPTSTVLICNNDIETAAEKSIEPPPYSPLTPRPDIAKNNKISRALSTDTNTNNALLTYSSFRNEEDPLTENVSEKSVESVNAISPLPLMSPDTATLFHILAESMNNHNSNNETLSDTSTIASLLGDKAQLFNDSDDSVRDPTYCDNTDNGSSDDRSNDSISLITGTAHTEINQIPTQINNITSYRPDPIILRPHSPPHGRSRKGRKPKYGGLSQILHASSEQYKADIEQKRVAHQEIANSLQTQLRTDMKLAVDDPTVETLTFDLEKTLPLPRIPTNIVFYKRQLWVYNLGIHTGSNDEAHCNVWVEGEAGRGAQEVGSCLIQHISERLDTKVKRLILWCDSCGGQNRNIKLTLMLKAMLNGHPTLDQINIRFLESGHSFLPNDSDFGKIECALKRQQRLYTPDDYIQDEK